ATVARSPGIERMTRQPMRGRSEPSPLAGREALRNLLRYDPADRDDLGELEENNAPPPVPRRGIGGAIALTIALGALTVLAIAATSLAEAASPSVAIPALERLYGSLTEVDGLVALHAPELQAQIEAGAPTLLLPGFFVETPVPVEDARTAEGALDPLRFRSALLATVAIGAYERSLEGGQPRDAVIAAATWALTAERYQQAFGLTVALVVAGAMLAVLMLWSRGGAAWLAIGLALALGGGATVAVIAGAGVLLEGGAATGNSLLRDEIDVVGALLGIPARNAVITTCLGAAFATLGLLRSIVRRQASRPSSR
ncbi:MAG: hypothetical protein U0360_05480, partial [Dehalococcoidia bacterium]